METAIDLRVAEMLCARLCHDLVGPVGAVNNGLELLEDDMYVHVVLSFFLRYSNRAPATPHRDIYHLSMTERLPHRAQVIQHLARGESWCGIPGLNSLRQADNKVLLLFRPDALTYDMPIGGRR